MRPFSILFIFLSILLTSCGGLFHSSKKTYAKAIDKAPYDVVIIPGYPYENGEWNVVLQMRLLWAKHLYDNGIAKRFIFSGSAVYTPYVEAKILAEYAKAMNIPDSIILIEEAAEHSVENVYYSTNMAHDLGYDNIAFATNWLQINIVRSFVRKHKIDVTYIPIQTNILKTLDHEEPKINPSVAIRENFVSIVERESKMKRFRGTLGHNVKWRKEE